MTPTAMTTAAIMTSDLVDHADRRQDRVEREDDVEQDDLDEDAAERRGRDAGSPSAPAIALERLVDLGRRLRTAGTGRRR